jgi:hypothetical protein
VNGYWKGSMISASNKMMRLPHWICAYHANQKRAKYFTIEIYESLSSIRSSSLDNADFTGTRSYLGAIAAGDLERWRGSVACK